ncbi:hypothetical protein ACFWXO_05145 [Kitasatospora sp. NPDC059088]|uniref:hypothetical protein n=1 Tax=Kitasatospora sp. NPDC059088 TaxID=3346722 RepID=UPI00369CD0C3
MADLTKPKPAAPVFDPALPTAIQNAVAELAAQHPDLLATDGAADDLVVSYDGSAQILRLSAATPAGGGIAALGAFLLGQLLGEPVPDGPSSTAQLDHLLRGLLSTAESGGLIVLAGGAFMAVMAVLLIGAENRHIDRTVAAARGHYVHPSWLTEDARALLARAQKAACRLIMSASSRLVSTKGAQLLSWVSHRRNSRVIETSVCWRIGPVMFPALWMWW